MGPTYNNSNWLLCITNKPMHSSGVIQGRIQLFLGGRVGNKKVGKVASRCNAYSAEAIVLSLKVKQLYDSDPHECCQFLVKY